MTDIRRKAENKVYKNASEVIEDLSKVIRFVDSGSKMFVQKEYDIHSKTWSLVFVNNLYERFIKDDKVMERWTENNNSI